MARQWLLAICVLVWSAATLVMGLATTFAGLVVGAFVLSMGEMALLPVFNSVVPDLFGQSLRRRINLAYGAVIVASAGAMLALAGAGLTFLAEHRDALPEVLRNLSTWRVAFVLTAALGLPLALGILWAGPVPRTGSAIAKEPAASFFQRHLRATLGLYAAVCLFGIGSSAVLSWTTIYMMRRFTLGPAELGAGVGVVLLASAILGILVSGFALKRLERSDPHTAPLKLYIAAFLLSIVPGALLLVVDNLTLAYVLMAAQFTLIFAAMAHNFSLVQELSPANARGQASGLFALSAGVVPAFAPLLVGLISDRLGTGAEGLMLSIMGVSIPAYLLGALVLRSRSLGYADVIRDANEPATPV